MTDIPKPHDAMTPQMRTLAGLATSRGFVAGPAFCYRSSSFDLAIPEYTIPPEGAEAEIARFHQALDVTRDQIRALVEEIRRHLPGDDAATIFDGHVMIIEDLSMRDAVADAIKGAHLNAEVAVRKTADYYIDIFNRMDDAYLRERAKDIIDISRRIIRNLTGSVDLQAAQLRVPSIIVGEDLTPSETVSLPSHLVLGFAIDRGSTTSHVALLARALGIPAVVGLGSVSTQVNMGDPILLDGTNGAITIHPDAATRTSFEHLMRRERELIAMLNEDQTPAGTMKDGTVIRVWANAHPGVPLTNLKQSGAGGVGLYRSEYLWMTGGREPSEDTQTRVYSDAVRAIPAGSGIVIRVLDIGGDKIVKEVASNEDNPFLGNRSIRYLLSHRDVFRRQLRSLLRASSHGRLAIMYPMISTLEEVREATAELHVCMDQLRQEGVAFNENIRTGVMIELPAAALIADALAREVDFFSIGTNDLIQYTMGADRTNEAVANLYQPTHPAILQLIDRTVQAGIRAGIHTSVCGETAADPVLGALWVGMGVTMLSMSTSYIPVIKKVLRQVTIDDLHAMATHVRTLYHCPAKDIYEFCRSYLAERIPDMDELQSFFTHGAEF